MAARKSTPKALPEASAKPQLSREDQQIRVAASLDGLGDKIGNLAAHIGDVETLLYERQDSIHFYQDTVGQVMQASSSLLSVFSTDLERIAEKIKKLGQIAEARGVDAAQKGGAA